MAGLIYDLINVLQEELAEYGKVKTLCIQKTEYIVQNDVEGLKETVLKENEKINNLKRLEKEREKIVVDITQVLNYDGQLTISKLIDLLQNSQNERQKLQDLHQKILKVIDDLKKTNDRNKQLINQALEMVDFTLNIIQSSNNLENTYKYDGTTNNYNINRSIFDKKQ